MSRALAVLHHLEAYLPPATTERLEWMSGWIFGTGGSRCCAVRARYGRQRVLALSGLPRPDVAAAYPDEPDAAWSGFRIGLAGLSRDAVCLEWLDEAGGWHEIWREPAASAAGRPRSAGRPVLPDALLPALFAAAAAAIGSRPWREAWRYTAGLLAEATSRETLLPPSPDCWAFLDEPAGECPEGDFVTVSGWIFGQHTPVRRIHARAEPGGMVHLVFPKPRPDVAAVHAGLSAPVACGFTGMIKLPAAGTRWFTFQLYAETADGSLHLALSRRFLRKSARDSVQPGLRAGFMLGAMAALSRCRPQSGAAWWRELSRPFRRDPVPPPAIAESRPPAITIETVTVERPPQDPLISILVPVYNTPERYLREMLASVQAQLYPHWELRLADDASTAGHVRPVLEEFARADPRIHPVFRPENGHIARATNTALGHAKGEYVALLDHDDLLAPEALLRVVEAMRTRPDAQFLYTDRDKVDDRGRHFDVELRGAWNPAMALTHNYLHQLTVIRRDLVGRVGGFRPDYFGAQDLDLYLRCHELIQPDQIVHVPVIGYHWRAHAGSTASRGDQKDYMFDSARRGIEDALQRRGLRAKPFLPGFAPFYGLNLHQLRWDAALLRENPVSIVLAAGPGDDDWPGALAALIRTVPAAATEVIVVSAGPVSPVKAVAGGMRVGYIVAPAGSGLAELFNRGAAVARHPLLLLLHAAAVPEIAGWLEDLAGWLSVPGVAAAGPKLIKTDGRLASAAGTLHPGTGLPQPLFADEAPDDLGHQFFLHAARDTLILDPACLLTRTALFQAAHGYDSRAFPAGFYAADYCLRLHDLGHRVVFTPQAVLRLAAPGGATGASDPGVEAAAFRRRHAGRTDPWIHQAPCPPARPGRGLPPDASRHQWMPEDTVEFAGGWFFLEHPRPGEVLAAGRQVIHGWCIGRANHSPGELRVRVGRNERLLTYGHPRVDLAELAGDRGEFYPVGFDLELDLPCGRARLEFEAKGEEGGWWRIDSVDVTVGPARSPVVSGLPASLTGDQFAEGVEWLVATPVKEALPARAVALARSLPWRDAVRNPSLPFHGYWDEPKGTVRLIYGGAQIGGWLFHETLAIRRVVASFSLTGWTDLSHRNDSPAIGARFAQFPAAAQCAAVGYVYGSAAGDRAHTLRLWAQLEDGGWHLVYVRRCWIRPAGEECHAPAPGAARRMLLAATLTYRWALWKCGVPGPGLAALWRASRQGRRKIIRPEDPGRPVRAVSAPRPVASPPHVLLVTHNLNEEGAPYFLLEFARHVQRETRARFTVVSPADGPLRGEFERHGMPVRLVRREPFWAARTPAETDRAQAALARELRAPEADLVVANTIESFWAVNAAHQAGRPALFYIHEPGVFGVHYLAQLGEAARRQAAAAINQADRVSFPSRAVQAYYEPLSRGENFRIQPGWTELGRLLPADGARTRAVLRTQLGLTPDDRLVINVGRLCPRKGQMCLVSAIERLWGGHPALAGRSRFLLIGSHDNDYGGMLAAQVARLRRTNITLLPATPRIGDYFAAADLFVLTSFEEGFPRVLLEAMGFGLPVVSTAVHAVPEIARAGREALLVPPGDAGALTGAIRRLLEDPPLARRLGQQARQRVEDNFTAERVLPGHLRTVLELVPELAEAAPRIPQPDWPEPVQAAS